MHALCAAPSKHISIPQTKQDQDFCSIDHEEVREEDLGFRGYLGSFELVIFHLVLWYHLDAAVDAR